MAKLNVTFDGITDTTGYLFSLAKCVAAVLKNSEYESYAEDIIAASGFAFRMWADPKQLCPSAASIWEFKKQKQWFENSGLVCGYTERLWGEDAVEEARRCAAVEQIRASIDSGCGAVALDISGCEWGILTGYDDEAACFDTLKIDGSRSQVPYEKLGKLELPILSVLTILGKQEKAAADIVAETKRTAASHLKGEEWYENAAGLAAYEALISFVRDKLTADTAWNLEYYLGTYGALKWYAWKFFERYGETELAGLYRTVYEAWKKAFDIKQSQDLTREDVRAEILQCLRTAEQAEQEALRQMA